LQTSTYIMDDRTLLNYLKIFQLTPEQQRIVEQKLYEQHHRNSAHPKSRATVEELDAAMLSKGHRDQCAHHLIPLNKCREEHYYLPWHCDDERVRYERCQYKHYLKLVKRTQRLYHMEQKLRLVEEQLEKARAKEGL
jgi:NADH dehydrogenase (ubiquinone) 1 beta subcomplex subunit 7